MISRVSNAKAIFRNSRGLAMLRTSEEFTAGVHVEPKAAKAATVKESTLPNGTKLITRDATSPVVHIQFAVLGGSSSETLNQKGSANLLARGAFAGNTSASGIHMMTSLEEMGAKVSASSDREKVSYKLSVVADKVDAAFAVVAGAIAAAPQTYRIDETKEHSEVFHSQSLHCPTEQLRDLVHEAAYGTAAPLGASAFAASLDYLSADDVLAFRTATFTANNLVVAASGLSHETLTALTNKHFAGLTASTGVSTTASAYKGGEVRQRAYVGGDVAHTAVAFPVPANADAAKPFIVVHDILRAHVAKVTASDDGSVSPFFFRYAQGGLIGVTLTGSLSSREGLAHVISVLKDVASGVVNADAAKTHTAVRVASQLDAADSTDALMAGGVASFSGVSSASVSAAAKSMLAANPAVAVLGVTARGPTHAEVVAMLK